MWLDTEAIVRFCRELVVVLEEIPADAVKPIRDQRGRVGRVQVRSGTASELRRDGLVLVGCVGRSGHGGGDLLARRRQRRCELAEARLAILLCNVAARRPHVGDPRRWTRDAILGALRSPPPKCNTW